ILLDALFLASERAPQLLLIDDLQLADELSTSFVRSPRLERLGQHRVCIIAASRTETDSPLGHRPLAGWEPLVLPRLDTDQTRLVLSDVLGAFTPSLEDWLYQRTEGNPLYLIEYVRRLVESTVLAFDAGQEKWRLTKQETSLPESLNELIDGRLASVGTAAKRVAAVVASLTTPFTLQSAQQAVAAVWGM